jgi:hypothetical protein
MAICSVMRRTWAPECATDELGLDLRGVVDPQMEARGPDLHEQGQAYYSYGA